MLEQESEAQPEVRLNILLSCQTDVTITFNEALASDAHRIASAVSSSRNVCVMMDERPSLPEAINSSAAFVSNSLVE